MAVVLLNVVLVIEVRNDCVVVNRIVAGFLREDDHFYYYRVLVASRIILNYFLAQNKVPKVNM